MYSKKLSRLLRDVMSGASSLFTPGRLERIFPGSLKARADPFWKRVAEECNYCEPCHPGTAVRPFIKLCLNG